MIEPGAVAQPVIQPVIILEAAERHRGADTPRAFLLKMRRTLTDILAGRTVRRWRLDRLIAFMEDVSLTCLRKLDEGRGGCF